MRSRLCAGIVTLTILDLPRVWAQQAPAAGSPAPTGGSDQVEQVTVTAQRLSLIGTATTASQGVVVDEELALTPDFRPGQLLETVPGLTVTAHSGEGKANQFLMRGYNLDHGTDLAVFVDEMPVNEPTHAHGQGYADLNFMLPELATNVTYTKGPYYADQGDFSSVGSVHVSYRDTIDDQVSASGGSFGFARLFTAGAVALEGGSLLGALELQHYDGPWVNPDDQRKLNAVLRFSSGNATDGYSITAMFYHDLWNATTDQPQRAITQGLIDRFGSLDPSDGGYAQRFSLSAQYRAQLDGGELAASLYGISNRMTLWNNFTHYLIDPIHGDQEEQHEDRVTAGFDVSYTRDADFAGFNNDVSAGISYRFDANDVLRLPTQARVLLTAAELAGVDYPPSYLEVDQVHLNSVALYLQAQTHWTTWLRTEVGVREDYMHGEDSGTNYGTSSSSLTQPKVNVIFTPVDTTELYLSWGRGFHSDDLRGVNQARFLGVPGAPLIASQTGEELGWRQQFASQIALTLALYNLDAQSETTYDPDSGQDSAGPASRRYGYEVNLTYQARRWLEFYASYSANHARFRTPYDDGTGHVGEYLPNAPFAAGSFNMYVKNLGPWDAGLVYRYVSSYPLSSDGVIRGHGYGEWNGEAHYSFSRGWTLGLGLYNILDTHANGAEFWYIDRLPGEPAAGVPDVHLHPLEPLNARFTVTKTF